MNCCKTHHIDVHPSGKFRISSASCSDLVISLDTPALYLLVMLYPNSQSDKVGFPLAKYSTSY